MNALDDKPEVDPLSQITVLIVDDIANTREDIKRLDRKSVV